MSNNNFDKWQSYDTRVTIYRLHVISSQVLEQIKTVIENRNQLASGTSPETAHVSIQINSLDQKRKS